METKQVKIVSMVTKKKKAKQLLWRQNKSNPILYTHLIHFVQIFHGVSPSVMKSLEIRGSSKTRIKI